MKKISLLLVCFLSLSAYSKEVPSPFWYSISEKILSGAQNLVKPADVPAKSSRKVVKKLQPVRLPLRCAQKKDTLSLSPFVTIKTNGQWLDAAE